MTTTTFIHVTVPIFFKSEILLFFLFSNYFNCQGRDRVVEGGIGLWRAVVGCEGRLKGYEGQGRVVEGWGGL